MALFGQNGNENSGITTARINPPQQILLDGGYLTLAGRGRCPGAFAYFSGLTNRSTEFFLVEIDDQAGASGKITGGANLERVRFTRRFNAGDVILAGAFTFDIHGPVAGAAIFLGRTERWHHGFIRKLDAAANFGFVSRDGDGSSIYFKRGALKGPVFERSRVTFTTTRNERGEEIALAIRPL